MYIQTMASSCLVSCYFDCIFNAYFNGRLKAGIVSGVLGQRYQDFFMTNSSVLDRFLPKKMALDVVMLCLEAINI